MSTGTRHRDGRFDGASTDPTNIVGDRTLLTIQTVNVSRLSTHPVPIVPGTLLVVAGQGPKDSNGAGKSSFIAAITALLGDEQWRYASGAKSIAELLFNAELAAPGDGQWASAAHGYVVGVFGPADLDATTNDLHESAVTVWLRINLDAPHLQIRWRAGVNLASASSESERVELADKIWDSLPRSAGRRDFLAKDLGRVLYGHRVRCVSFLSTSVRSRVATNLLSQPLNEISPERIFSALAALTGLDRELETERKLRADEHAERARAAQALHHLEQWEAETSAMLRTFDRHDEARRLLARAQEHWRSRHAQRLVDSTETDRVLAADLKAERARVDEATAAIRAVDQDIAGLRDDELDQRVVEAERAETQARATTDELGRDRAVTEAAIDELRARASELTDTVREADGRDVESARIQGEQTQAAKDAARERLGAAKDRLESADEALRAAEAGAAGTPDQLAALMSAGVEAAALVDVIDLDADVRDWWEAALWPYRDAVVVTAAQRDDAIRALAGHPGSVLVPAHPCPDAPEQPSPGVRTSYQLGDFFAALTARIASGDQPQHIEDRAAGVVIIAGFAHPKTGRQARIRAAEDAVTDAQQALAAATETADSAAGEHQRATRRLEGARAAARVEDIEQRLAAKRERLAVISAQLDELQPRLDAAVGEHRALRGQAANRDTHIELREKDKNRHENTRHSARSRASELADRRTALVLDQCQVDWGGTEASAHEWLANLDAHRSAEDWHREAQLALDAAFRAAFPDGGGDPKMPEQVRLYLAQREGGDGARLEREARTFDGLADGLGSRLREWEDDERQNRAQIERQRAERRRDFEAASKGVEEAAGAAEMGRSTVTKAIRSRLQKVAEHFDQLDLAYGGYGATLEFPTPQPPADPEDDWRWRVTPRWRRAEGQTPVPYNRRANTALMDEKAVKLVCAAALASAAGANLCLVLDELGRNLGKEHRREAVALFRQIGETHGITVVGALQDDMEPYAIDACGEYVKLRRTTDAVPYNEPPVVVAHDEHADRVRVLGEVISASRTSG